MDKFDRKLQRELLKELYDTFPYGIHSDERAKYYKSAFGDENDLVANLFYLRGHGLIECELQQFLSLSYLIELNNTKITSKGIDFIRDDGGLSAILNVQTIKLHRDTIMAIEDLIAISNLPESEKASVVSKLRELPASAITHLMNELISKAIGAAPAALQIIQRYLQGG